MLDFYYSLLVMSAVAAALFLILRLLSKWTQKYFTATWHYYSHVLLYTFFIIPYFKLVSFLLNLNVPQTVQHRVEILPEIPVQQGISRDSALPLVIQDGSRMTDQASNVVGHFVYNLLQVIPYILAFGTIAFIIVTLIKNMKIHRRIFAVCELTDDPEILRELTLCKRKLGMKQQIPVYLSPYISTPFLYGMFKPRIVLPAAMEFTAEEYQQVFLHELTHYKRHDVWIKCLLLAVNALHWFNPIAYKARQDADRFSELSCDEQIVQTMNSTERIRYCELLLNVLWNVADQKVKLYSAFSDKGSYLERRISMILKNDGTKKKKSVRMLAISMTLSLALVGTGAVYAGSEKASEFVDKGNTGLPANSLGSNGAEVELNTNPTARISRISDENLIEVPLQTTGEMKIKKEDHMINLEGGGRDVLFEVEVSSGNEMANFVKGLPANSLDDPGADVSKSDTTHTLDELDHAFSGNLSPDSGYLNAKQTLHEGASITIAAEVSLDKNFQVGIYSHTTDKTYFETVTNDSDSVTFDILTTGEYSIYVGNPSAASVRWNVSYVLN